MTEPTVSPTSNPSADVSGLFSALLLAVVQERDFDRVIPKLDPLLNVLGDEVGSAFEPSARQAHEVVRRLRTRERELSALYETAGEIAMQPDLDDTLSAIVRRAKQLLRADVTYLMLLDSERGETYMRATEGAFTAPFRDIRLAAGVGLGGTVVAEGQPRWTSRYSADTRFRHDVDDIVAAERIVAILGVPLRVGERVIGALFAADRFAREFASEEVALLCSLADHASIAIEAKASLQERATALDELAAAQREIRETSVEIATSADIHEQLTRLVTTGGRVADVLSLISERLHRHAVLLDRAGEVRHQSTATTDGQRVFEMSEFRDGLEEVVTTMRPASLARPAPDTTWIFPVAADGELQAFLAIVGPAMSEIEIRTGERAALVIAFLEMFERARSDAESRFRSSFLIDLLAGDTDELALRSRADLLGLDLSAGHRLVVASAPAGHQLVADGALWAFSPVKPVVTALWHNRLVMLVAEEAELERELGALHRQLSRRAGSPVTMGYSDIRQDTAGLRAGFLEADQCVDALIAFGRPGEIAEIGELGAIGFLIRSASSESIADFIDGQLSAIEEYDRKRNTNLLRTAEAYFRFASSPSEASRELGIHLNTLYQRLTASRTWSRGLALG